MRHFIFVCCLRAALLFVLPDHARLGYRYDAPHLETTRDRGHCDGGRSNLSNMVGTDRSLAYDHHGNPGIAFANSFDATLRYARRVPGIGWATSAVDTTSSASTHRWPTTARATSYQLLLH